MTSSLESKFYERIRHDFRKYVMLTSNRMHLNEDSILHYIYHLDGYKAHKKIKYGQFTSHIIIKFHDVYYAMEAVARLNFEPLKGYGIANLLYYLLKGWFYYEKRNCSERSFSLSVVDITGTPLSNVDLLTNNVLKAMFGNFGEPLLLGIPTIRNKKIAVVLFHSMTEALAASICFGEWHYCDLKTDSFAFRVRIVPLNMEISLIEKMGGSPTGAFKLEYFLNGMDLVNFQEERARRIRKNSRNVFQLYNNDEIQYIGTPVIFSPYFQHGTNNFQ